MSAEGHGDEFPGGVNGAYGSAECFTYTPCQREAISRTGAKRSTEVLEDQIVDDCLVERLDVLAVFKLRELQATSPPVSS